MSDDLRARYLPRFVELAARRTTRALECLTAAGAGEPSVARAELHTLAGEAGMLGLAAIAITAQGGETEARRWLERGDVTARSRCALAVRQLQRDVRRLAGQLAAETAPAAPAANRRILVIDDSELIAAQVCDELRAGGCEATGATDVDTMLRLVRELRPHVVVLDVNMPGVSLADVCARAREAAGAAPLSICLLSGVSNAELDIHARRVGADGFVSKIAGLHGVVEHVRRIAAELR